jgi:hypothetical protein
MKLPHQQKRITYILVGGTRELIHKPMHNLTNFIDEEHDTFLEDLCGVGEVSYITETEYCHYFLTW